jgi:hypothetical protein
MGGTWGMHGVKEKCIKNFGLKIKGPLERPNTDGEIILKYISER